MNHSTPPGPSPISPSLLFEYQCRSGKFIRLANRIESKKSIRQRESNRIESKLFCPNWNALQYTAKTRWLDVYISQKFKPGVSVHRKKTSWFPGAREPTITAAAADVLVTDRCRHLPPRTPAPPRKQLSRTSVLARVSYGGMCPGTGQMSSTGADDGRAYSHARHLILMRCASNLWA